MRFNGVKASALVLVLWAGRALGQQDSEINTAYQSAAEGLKAFDEGKYAESLEQFSQAFSIVRLPSLALYMARARVKLGHLLAARDLYTEAARLPDGLGDPEVQHAARRAAATESEALQAKIPRLVIDVPGAPEGAASVVVDSNTVLPSIAASGWQVDPGPHQVTVRYAAQQQTQVVVLDEGETKHLSFQFPQVSPPPPTPTTEPPVPTSRGTVLRKAGWVTLAIGGTSLAAAGASTVLALSKRGELDERGPWDVGHCEAASSVQDCRDYATLRTLSTITFYTGVAGVATGVALLLWPKPTTHSSKPGSISRWVPVIGAGYAGVQGKF